MLTHKQDLIDKKNLLAFSAGGDSTALFFLLIEHKIPFDIAIVDYAIREQSKEELAYAQKLAKHYNLQCHTLLASPIKKNFEANAREIRYDFFEQLIRENSYENLLTAHHLGDRFEWMLMQFCKGAGCIELSGMQHLEQRENYTLVRPLLHLEKGELLAYLHKHNYHYFEDASNKDERYKRNSFRKHYALPLLKQYKEGIKKSFEYIDEDARELIIEVKIYKHKDFVYFQSTNKRSNITHLDRYFKSLGKVLSAQERKLLKMNESVIIAREYVVQQRKDFVFLAPFVNITMDKKFKEHMRKLHIAPKLRAYIFKHKELQKLLNALLS